MVSYIVIVIINIIVVVVVIIIISNRLIGYYCCCALDFPQAFGVAVNLSVDVFKILFNISQSVLILSILIGMPEQKVHPDQMPHNTVSDLSGSIHFATHPADFR